jgi:hypothetical protein
MTTLAAICLNEEEFVEAWLRYHYESFDRILLCEGADRNYPPEAVTEDGLSRDRTAEIVYDFPDPDSKIEFIQHGWAGRWSKSVAAPGKMELRNVYAERLQDGYVYTLDLDEFLHPDYVADLNDMMDSFQEVHAYAIPLLHLWQNTSQFITGRYADTPHYRLYRWREGSRYRLTHNWPSGPDGVLLTEAGIIGRLMVEDGCLVAPALIHYGFCERKGSTAEKNDYYIIRGENDTRPDISEFRNAALQGIVLDGCELWEYYGFLPFEPEPAEESVEQAEDDSAEEDENIPVEDYPQTAYESEPSKLWST